VLSNAELALLAVGEELPGVATIAIDNFEGAYRATNHLIDVGHTRIAIAGSQQLALDASPVLALRVDGYRAALEDAGLKPRHEYDLAGMLSPAGGRAALDDLIELAERPTAVFFLSDEMAMGGLAQARRRGLHVPSELSVVGFDDHSQAEAAGLTTIRQRVRELGVMAAQRMLGFGDDHHDTSHELVPIELVVRHTTSSPH
ncbi:MAG: substrate-binding domain-containing protein, partial [Acidimicrobiia bacterium]|nr:substrate-binding domain-containing protein [Acidimicrobiia bacterium]